MRPRLAALLAAATLGLAIAPALADPAAAPPAKPAPAYNAPKNEYGQPDLQGVWTNATLTEFERPAEYGDRLTMTPQEVAKAEGDNAKAVADGNAPTDPKLKVTDLPYNCGRGFTGVDCGYNAGWVDPGTTVMRVAGEPRTSLITRPANGRTPPLLPAARQRLQALYAQFRGAYQHADNPETRALG